MRVALATCARLPTLTADDHALVEALRARGASVLPAVWDDGGVDWAGFDAVVLRSVWDYHLKPVPFAAWLDRVERAGPRLWNPPTLVRWNMQKTYLAELAARRVPVVATEFVEAGQAVRLQEVLARRGWAEAVVKPALSASAYRTARVAGPVSTEDEVSFAALVSDGGVLVQAYVPEVAAGGEWSLVFVDGAFSHAAVKRPAAGDFRVQSELGGTVEAAAPPADVREAAARVLAEVPRPWLYARVDGVVVRGTFTLMELELIEPVLFLELAPEAGGRLADALLRGPRP